MLDDLSIDGPGKLRVACDLDLANGGRPYEMQDCRITWFNTFRPDLARFAGKCGDTVTVPGLYVIAADAKP